METALVALGSALLGSIGGGWWIDRQGHKRREKQAISAILLETSLLVAVLEGVVFHRERRRTFLQKQNWDQFGAEAANYLPQHLLKALYLLYVDSFDTIVRTYELSFQEISDEVRQALDGSLLGWAYHAERTVQLIQEDRAEKRKWQIWRKKFVDTTGEVWGEIERYAKTKTREKGYDPYVGLHVDFDGNVSVFRVDDEGNPVSD